MRSSISGIEVYKLITRNYLTKDNCNLSDVHVQKILLSSQLGETQYIETLLNNGVHPEYEDINGNTPLQVASANGQEEVIALLLNRCALVHHANNCGWTPVLHAAYHGHVGVVDKLLANKAKVNEANKLGLMPLVAAVCGGHSATVRLLLDAGAAVDGLESSDFTPLMASALYGHEDILCLLLDRGAAVNQAANSTKLTPLMMAACGGFKAVAQRLVECGADTNAINICGHTALDIAVTRGKWEVKAYLSDKTNCAHLTASKSQEAEMMENIKQGNESAVKSLLSRQPELVNWCENDGATLLMEAAIAGHLQLVKFLVVNGSVLDQQDKKNGWTALMQAVYHEHIDVIQVLLAAGASIDVVAFDGYTALDLAWLLEKPNIAHNLLEWKTDQMALSRSGMSELMLHKPSALKSSLRLKQSRKPKIMSLLGHVTTRLQMLKSPRRSTSVTPPSPSPMQEATVDEYNSSPEVLTTNKTSPMSILKLSSFRCKNEKISKEPKIWDMPLNPPLLPTPETVVLPHHLPPKLTDTLQTPKKAFRPVHLMRKYQRQQEMQAKQSNSAEISAEECVSQNPADNLEKRNASMKTVAVQCGISSADNVENLLQQLSLDRYVEKIRHHEIGLETLKMLTEDNLEEIGISCGPRKQLLLAINLLKSEENQH